MSAPVAVRSAEPREVGLHVAVTKFQLVESACQLFLGADGNRKLFLDLPLEVVGAGFSISLKAERV